MLDLLKIILLLVVFQFYSNLFSHGGGLNSEGCQNNRKTGDYHCHRKKKNN